MMCAQESHTQEAREIERVWVLRAMPEIPCDVHTEVWQIEQGYLAPVASTEIELEALGFPEGRLRRVVEPSGCERFFHTVKSGTGMVRVETEREITQADFMSAWPRTAGRRLVKTRYRAHIGAGSNERVWEIDRFRDLPLVMVEVELPSEHAACEMPSWIASLVEREVTFDARYRNAALAMTGLPKS